LHLFVVSLNRLGFKGGRERGFAFVCCFFESFRV